jgi:transposase
MLADQLDYIIGVDPHRDSHAVAVVHVQTGAVVFETNVVANSDGYAQALKLVDGHAHRICTHLKGFPSKRSVGWRRKIG